MRLRGGFGTPCDTIHTGYIEVLHDGEWGNICTNSIEESRATNTLVPDVVCRQLGFPYGGRVDPLPAVPPPQQGDTPSPPAAEDQIDRYWLFSSETTCTGPEQRLLDCELVRGFSDAVNQQCLNDFSRHRLYVACRQFPVTEALEGVTTPGAGMIQTCIAQRCIISGMSWREMHIALWSSAISRRNAQVRHIKMIGLR